MNSLAKRFTALLLSLMMIFVSVFGSAFSVYAAEIPEENSSQPAQEQIIDEKTEDKATGDEEIKEEAPEAKEEATEEAAPEAATEPVKEEAQEVAKEEVIEEKAEAAPAELPEEEEEAAPEEVAFEASKTVNGVKVTVKADKGVFPAGSSLRVKALSSSEEAKVEKAIEKVADDAEVAVQYNFDICILDKDGNEVEPKGEAKVTFETEEIADGSLKAEVFHVKDNGKAEALNVETKGEKATFETDGFSPYSLRFTFYNETTGHNEEIDLAINDTVTVQRIANALGYSSKTVSAAQTDASSVIEVWKDLNDVWYVRALNGDTSGTHGLEIYFTDGTKVNATIRTHIHSWNFTVSGNQASLKCAADHCVHTGTYTKTISASNAVYDGNGHGASLSGDISGGDVTIGDIHYAAGTNVTTGGSTTAPVNAGTYTAYVSIQPHGASAKTIYTTFTIAKADTIITTDAQAIAGLVYNGDNQTLHTRAYAKSKEADATEFDVWYKDASESSYSSRNLRTAKNAGTYTINYKALGDANHNPSAEKTLSITIGTKGVQITGIDAANKVYDSTNAASMILSGKTIIGVVSGESLNITATGTFNDKKVGTDKPVSYSVTLVAGNDGTKASNYHVASKNDVYANITQKHLLLDWDNATELQYNGQFQAPTAIIKPGNAQNATDGKVYAGDVVKVELTEGSYKKEVGGPFEAHATNLSGTDAANYYLDDHHSNVGAKFSIVPRVVDVNWADLTQVYDARVLAPTVSLTDSVAAAENVSVSLIQPTDAKNAGVYTATAQLTGDTKSNFVINPYTVSKVFTITKAPLTVKANGWLYYGELIGQVKDASYKIVSGLKGSDTEAVLKNTGRFETDYGKKYNREGFASDPVTDEEHSYYLLPVFENADNYEIINTDGELTVYPKPVTLAWTHTHARETEDISEEKTYIYDGKKHIYKAEVTELSYVHVNGIIVEDKIEVTLEDNIERDACIKKNHDKYTAKAMKLSNKNYSLFYKDGRPVETKSINYVINQRPIELSWAPSNFTYNAEVQKPEYKIENLQTNDEGVMDASFEISQAIEKESAVFDSERDLSIEAGEWNIAAINEESGYLNDKNYTLAEGTGLDFDYTITARPILLSWDPANAELTYDAKEHTQNVDFANLAANDKELVELVKDESEGMTWTAKDAGTYKVSVTAIQDTDDTKARIDNYTFAKTDRTWKINQAPLTITANAKSITYGDMPANAGIRYAGFKGDDNASVLTGALQYQYNYARWGRPGTYRITPYGLSAKNYKITFKAGNLYVNGKNSKIVASATASGKTAAVIRWSSVTGAKSYSVYIAKCDSKKKKYALKKVATVSGNAFTVKKLKKNTFYKFYVISDNGVQSQIGHFATGNSSGKYTNVKSYKLNASTISLNRGAAYALKGSFTKANGKKKLPTNHAANLRCFSENPSVATVTAGGVIKGVSTGWCRIYVQTANGLWKTVEVYVR